MNDPDKLFAKITRVQDFSFDDQVAKVFDDMVARSIPFYNEIQRVQTELIMEFLPDTPSVVCDLGCSTVTTLAHLVSHPDCPAQARFIGYDNAEAMLAKAQIKLANQLATGQVALYLQDLCQLQTLPRCHVAILNWTLQFVRPLVRERLLACIYQALQPSGILLLSEKILANDPLLNSLYIDNYLHFKKSQSGYTDFENQRKREALENVLVPYRLDENILLLQHAGFKHVDSYFQWFNFVCLLAVKT